MSLSPERLQAIRERAQGAAADGLQWEQQAIAIPPEREQDEWDELPNSSERFLWHAHGDIADLLAERDALEAQVAALVSRIRSWTAAEPTNYVREIILGTHPGDAQGCAQHIQREAAELLADTAAAADAHDRQQRLEGARRFAFLIDGQRRVHHEGNWCADCEATVLQDMEREAKP